MFIGGLTESPVVNDQYQIPNDKWKMESNRHGEETPERPNLFSASPESEPSNTEPGQRLRVLIRIRLLFKARPAEIFGVPYFQIFQISEDHHLARQVRFIAQHRVD